MKYLVFSIGFCLLALLGRAQASPAEEVAQRIATKMRDSLVLSAAQKEQVYTINLQLHARKTEVRRQFAGSALLTEKVQQVEGTRDSLYRGVLTAGQYQLYRGRKAVLVNNE